MRPHFRTRTVITVATLVSCLLCAAGRTARAEAVGQRGDRFDHWVASLWGEARKTGVSRETFQRAFEGVVPDEEVIQAAETQPEFVRPIWDYLDRAVSEARIADGKAQQAAIARDLDAIEKTYGVEPHIVVAIWGMESAYGTSKGDRSVIQALATLAYQGSRRDYGKAQLIAALQILQRGDVSPEAMRGSWAGAMGHTQFIPTTYNVYAVDHDGDGRRDIWTTPADGLASAANYLRKSGWISGEAWGYEVVLPKGFDFANAKSSVRKPIAEWLALGISRADGRKFDAWATEGSILLPAGAQGPAFLVFRNFRAILRYNNATAYALGIGHLADRLRGEGPLVAAWPRGDLPLTGAQRRELQERLAAKGLYKGGVDGLIGSGTQDAIRNYQHRLGLEPDGYPSAGLLERLRQDG
jgi:membrane-bound lytic murein transglycosylase B